MTPSIVCTLVQASEPYSCGWLGPCLASVADTELPLSWPVIWLHSTVKELRADIILHAVGLSG